MIIENGYLQQIKTKGGGMEKGRPIPQTETRGCKIPCNIKTIKNNLHGKSVDGIFRQTEFEVLIDINTTEKFTATKVALTDNREQDLGVFWVQDIQHLDHVGAIKIDVAHAD